jgi:hypothetical protein
MLGVCVFAISPILLLDLPGVFITIMHEARSTHLGQDAFGYWGNLYYYLRYYSRFAGVILSAFCVFGFLCFKKENRPIHILLALGMLYAPIISMLALHWGRWGVPFYAYCLVFAAAGIWRVFELLGAVGLPKIKRALTITLVSLCSISFVNLCVGSVAAVVVLALPIDTRAALAGYVAEIGATRENTLSEVSTEQTGAENPFAGFENGDIAKPKNPEIKYVIVSSYNYANYYAEPERYSRQVAFYDALKENKAVLRELKPSSVSVARSPNDFVNIASNLQTINKCLNGGYVGPNIIIYQY